MRLAILCPIFGNRPNSLYKIQLLPAQSCNFLAALAGERQQFNNATIWTANLARGEDDLGEFSVV